MADVVVDPESKNPTELLGQGIRAYVIQDYNSAVTALGKASELLVARHGDDMHESLGDVYLYYGKALLGLSREESEALGDAVPKNNDSDDEEEIESAEAEDGSDIEENGEATTNGATEETQVKVENPEVKVENPEVKVEISEGKLEHPEVEVENPEVKIENSDVKIEISEVKIASEVKIDSEVTKEMETGEGSSKTKETKLQGPADPDNDDEPTDLQVAWEVLELAKQIYQKQGKDGLKNLAETLTVLGEISLESENFEMAIMDIKEGLRIQKELSASDSRTVAEMYYKLGIAYSTDSQMDEAIQSFKSSLEYLQNRINTLEKIEDKKDEVEEEIKEIKSLIPDIEEKIADMNSYKDEALKKIMSAVAGSKDASSDGASTSSNSSKPVTNISHLVKRKRKLDDIVEESEKEAEASPAKKTPT